MLDTVVLVTTRPPEAGWEALCVKLQARRGSKTDGDTGEVTEDYVHYSATLALPKTNGQVRIQVRTSQWVVRPGEKTPSKIDIWSLRLEASLHKAMLGHNVFGGPLAILSSCRYLVAAVGTVLEVALPAADIWQIRRLDIAQSFDLHSLDNVLGWIRSKSLASYPRRTVHFWGSLGFTADGTTTCVRAYAKGPQLDKEGGFTGLCKVMPAHEAFNVNAIAQRILRTEVEIKAAVWDKTPTTVAEADEGWLDEQYSKAWQTFLRLPEKGAELAHTALEAELRLRATYGDTGYVALYAVWCMVALRGEDWYRRQVPASTWRHQRGRLETAGITWLGTDVLLLSAPGDIRDFAPTLDSPNRLSSVAPAVAALESEYSD